MQITTTALTGKDRRYENLISHSNGLTLESEFFNSLFTPMKKLYNIILVRGEVKYVGKEMAGEIFVVAYFAACQHLPGGS